VHHISGTLETVEVLRAIISLNAQIALLPVRQ
jgi:hypothetical protein